MSINSVSGVSRSVGPCPTNPEKMAPTCGLLLVQESFLNPSNAPQPWCTHKCSEKRQARACAPRRVFHRTKFSPLSVSLPISRPVVIARSFSRPNRRSPSICIPRLSPALSTWNAADSRECRSLFFLPKALATFWTQAWVPYQAQYRQASTKYQLSSISSLPFNLYCNGWWVGSPPARIIRTTHHDLHDVWQDVWVAWLIILVYNKSSSGT
ncbi:hypothetical protein EDB84DRAFT_1500023 [Lactarius hengduanensis]|nr:hypothetical protein EDB84DRAFT_1500023 [Lactarius hengduanensis]